MNPIKFYAKRLLFPGLDLHTRCRYRRLPLFFVRGECDTLDAGCGNGALSYAAYRLGNRVLAVSFDEAQVANARDFFERLGTDKGRLIFDTMNLYDLPKLTRKFDQIICSETIEHIKDDRLIVKHFYQLLKPGGILHLCAPYALHPEHFLGRVDGVEDGGHVRDGYTEDSYRRLLEPAGFEVVRFVGIGSPVVVALDKGLRFFRRYLGNAAAPFFLAAQPFLLFDYLNSATPYSLYVQARKR